MAPNRDITGFLNYLFDNVVPPFLRDNKYFMRLFFYPLFGKKARHFMEFREKAPFLTGQEYREYYRLLSDRHLKRKTDLNKKSIRYIVDNISGDRILDIACGRGFLAKLLAEKFPGKDVTGVDIILPEIEHIPGNISLKTGNIENIDYPDSYFDTVVCAHTLEHVQNIQAAIDELRRVCREKLIIVVPRQREYRYTFDLHLHFFPYLFSLQKVMKNSEATYRVIKNDIVYTELFNKGQGITQGRSAKTRF